MRIGENPPIRVLHSPTVKEYKSLFFLSFKDITLMYYMVDNDATLLHQTNDDINKVYQKNRPTMTPNDISDNVYKLNELYSPCLLQKTNYLLKCDNKVTIFK